MVKVKEDTIDSVYSVEAFIGNKPRDRRFIKTKKGVYLNVSSFRKSLISKGYYPGKGTHLDKRPVKKTKIIKSLLRSIFWTENFSTAADLILIHCHINLFYLDKRIRVKIYYSSHIRSLEQFKNEYIIRKKVEDTGVLHVPRIIEGNLRSEPYFFIDEIVFGKKYNWNDQETRSVFKNLIPHIWDYYRKSGIVWKTLRQQGIDILKTVDDYSNLIQQSPYDIDIDLNKIIRFSDLLAPCSFIHGDLTPYNVILAQNGIYVIDWELARHDFIVYDWMRPLLIKEWNLREDIEYLMTEEINKTFGVTNDSILSLSDQCYLMFFLNLYKTLKKYPSNFRRIQSFQKQFKNLF